MAWKAPRTSDEDEARRFVEQYYDAQGDSSVFEASADVQHFYDELLARYPPLEAHPADHTSGAQSPWSVTPERSDRVIEMSMRWGTPDEALTDVVELARKHDLVLYDPQGPTVHWPEGTPAANADPAGGTWWLAAIGVAGVLVIVLGWYMPYRIIGWPLIGIGLFVVAVVMFLWVLLRRDEGRT